MQCFQLTISFFAINGMPEAKNDDKTSNSFSTGNNPLTNNETVHFILLISYEERILNK